MKSFAIAVVASFLLACGGSQPAGAEAPEGGEAGELTDEGAEAPRPSDGIVRDADGDGIPDEQGAGCAGKNETQCQITAGCAWSDTGECVEAGGM